MVLPDSERTQAIAKARKMVEDGDEIVAVGPYGVVLRDKHGNTLTVTKEFCSFEPGKTATSDS